MKELIQINSFPVCNVLKSLLQDKTTGKNIIFATDNYSEYGCTDTDQITVDLLLSFDAIALQPRVLKAQSEQSERTRKKAEVFTPTWICNFMNNHCDEEWFGKTDIFNKQDGENWKARKRKIPFKTAEAWQQYILSRRLEITCGEAPFLVSRYDTTTGELIPVQQRVGMLDRKLRVVNENATDETEWWEWVIKAYESTYGYEFQGDNLLIARINLLVTFCDNLQHRWQREATESEIIKIANIISWNIWQMDGLDLISVRQNIFIAGASGTGKGNLFIYLAKQLYETKQLYEKDVSFLFIESAKNELHHLRKFIPSLKVWRPEPGGFVLNPFSIPEDLTYGEYNNSLQTILHTCFDIDTEGSALTRLFPDALEQCFFQMNYGYDSTNSSPDVQPFGINEFASTYSQLLDMQDYQDKDKKNIRQAGLNKIKSLYENRYIFDSIHSIPISELTTGFNVLQLSSLGSTSSKQFFVTLLLIQINAWLKARFRNTHNNDLNLVIAIDESHNLFQSVSNTHGVDYSFVTDFSRNLLEHRSSGIGYVIADQSAHNLPPQIIQSCATKIFLGANLDSGIQDYLLELHMDKEQLHNLYTFKAGDGVFYTYGLESGLSFHTDDLISDLHVYEDYDTVNSYLSRTRITIETYQECLTCPMQGKCDMKAKQRATMLAEKYYFIHRDDILEKYFAAKQENNKQQCTEYGEKLVQTLQDIIKEENDVIYCCFIQQILRHYKREHKNMLLVNGTVKFINNIIEKRRKKNGS